MSGKRTAEGTPLLIRFDDETVTGTLAGNATARSLIEQLPLTLSFNDYGGQEKLAELAEPLSLAGAPTGDGADPLTIGYYAPGQALVLYYGHVGYFRGIVRIGTFDGLATVRDRAGRFKATISLA